MGTRHEDLRDPLPLSAYRLTTYCLASHEAAARQSLDRDHGLRYGSDMEETGLNLGMFNFVDLAVGVYLVWGLIRGLRRGLSRELAGLLTMVVAVGAGWKLCRPLGEKIVEVTRLDEQGSHLLAFVIGLLIAAFAMVALRWILKNLAEFSFKGSLERVGGALAGIIRCGMVAIAAIIVCSLCPIDFISRKFSDESVLGSAVSTHLLPAYAALTDRHPELDLPVLDPGGEDTSLAEEMPDAYPEDPPPEDQGASPGSEAP